MAPKSTKDRLDNRIVFAVISSTGPYINKFLSRFGLNRELSKYHYENPARYRFGTGTPCVFLLERRSYPMIDLRKVFRVAIERDIKEIDSTGDWKKSDYKKLERLVSTNTKFGFMPFGQIVGSNPVKSLLNEIEENKDLSPDEVQEVTMLQYTLGFMRELEKNRPGFLDNYMSYVPDNVREKALRLYENEIKDKYAYEHKVILEREQREQKTNPKRDNTANANASRRPSPAVKKDGDEEKGLGFMARWLNWGRGNPRPPKDKPENNQKK